MAGRSDESDRGCDRVSSDEGLRSSEEDDLLHRSTKKVKGAEADFTGDCSGLRNYEDLEEMEEIGSPNRKSYCAIVSGADDTEVMDGIEVEDDDFSVEDDVDSKLRSEEKLESEVPAEESYEIIEHPKGKHSVPEFIFSKRVVERICVPFKKAVVVKLLGRMIGIKALESRLKDMWGRKGELSVTDVPNDYYIVLFDSKDDYEFAIEGGPWMIYDHYLMVRTWNIEFNPWTDSVENVMVWVRFPDLPLQYYDEFVLRALGNRIGKTIRVDLTTSKLSRGKFARLCVEVDLSKPLLPLFILREREYRVEYEGLHTLCFNCGRFGHVNSECPERIEVCTSGDVDVNVRGISEDNGEELYGPWTVVKKTRKKKVDTKRNASVQKEPDVKGSRFSSLAGLEAEGEQAEPSEEVVSKGESPRVKDNLQLMADRRNERVNGEECWGFLIKTIIWD